MLAHEARQPLSWLIFDVRQTEMRRLDPQGKPADLPPEEIAELLQEHVPYRVDHLVDAIPRIPARCMADNQAFEAGAVAGRSLLSLLGIAYDPKTNDLKDDRCHRPCGSGMTDDVKAPDLGGQFIDRANLTEDQRELLARFIRGVHKSSAHFTWRSSHGLDVPTYRDSAMLIFRLLKEHLPQMVEPCRGANALSRAAHD